MVAPPDTTLAAEYDRGYDDGWSGRMPKPLGDEPRSSVGEVGGGSARRRLRTCVEKWPEEDSYNPSCCRFPKSCSCMSYAVGVVLAADLEPPRSAASAAAVKPPPPEGDAEAVHRLRQRLAGWHFAQESLTDNEREILHVGEQVLREHDALTLRAARLQQERDEAREQRERVSARLLGAIELREAASVDARTLREALDEARKPLEPPYCQVVGSNAIVLLTRPQIEWLIAEMGGRFAKYDLPSSISSEMYRAQSALDAVPAAASRTETGEQTDLGNDCSAVVRDGGKS